MAVPTERVVIVTGNPLTLLLQIRDQANALLVPGDVTGLAVAVFNTRTAARTYHATITPGDAILDPPETGQGWSQDATGFNFSDVIPGSAFPDNGARYQVQYTFTTDVGTWTAVPALVDTQGAYSSE